MAIFVLVCVICIQLSFAQSYTVAIKQASPFVNITDSGDVEGFSIDLLRELYPASSFEYKIYPTVQSHIDAVSNGSVDFGIAATTITAQRELAVDFTHPFYDSSLGVAVRESQSKNIIQLLFSPELLTTILVLFVYMIACGHIIWWIEKGKGFDKKYKKGVSKGMWWTIVTMSTVGYGDVVPETPRGKAFGSFVIITGIMLFGLIIAQLSSLSVAEKVGVVDSIADLDGKQVAVIVGAQSQSEVLELGATLLEVDTIEQGFEAVKDRRAVAFVHDEPLLRPLPNEIVMLDTFAPSPYGIMTPIGSHLREDINRRLLQLHESGGHQQLVEAYFGD